MTNSLAPSLLALSGPLAGRSSRLGADAFSIGRHAESSLQVLDAAASRQHCRIERAGDAYLLRDLGSRLGTFVNGRPVGEHWLSHGDLVVVADTLLSFQVPSAEPPPEPAPATDARSFTARTTQRRPAGWQPEQSLAPALCRTLLRVAKTLQAPTSTAELAEGLLAELLELLPADRGALLLTERGSAEVERAFTRDRHDPRAGFVVSRTVARQVLGGEALLAADVLLEEKLAAAESLRAERICSLIAAPLVDRGHTLGLLYAETRENALAETHLELLAALGGLAAGALAQVGRQEWLDRENRRLAESLDRDMVGESPRMKELYRLLRRAAASDATVLLRGESGTGKELAARALHQGSPRAAKSFVAVNCATLSETLLESELFGHEKGAFTGAVARKLGKAEAAEGGTLFLDEVGELPLPVQAKLLRFLQERVLERVGGTRPIPVDVRVVAATNRDLEKAIREGTFREDLYYRLNVVTLQLPPLRERREDIPLLASHFAARCCRQLARPPIGFSPQARACLQRYDWPGNVRELANAVERALVLGEGEAIEPEDLPETLVETAAAPQVELGAFHHVVVETKKQLIRAAVAEAGGNISQAAVRLGLQPTYLHRLIRNLELRGDLTR